MAEEVLPKRLLIRSWPKMILLWPTGVLALIMSLAARYMTEWEYLWGGVFLGVMALNLFVLTFEFPRGAWLTATLAVLAVVLLLLLINHNFEVLPFLKRFLISRKISASYEFYWAFFLVYVVLFIGMFITTRFDYWELTPNEIVHHFGLLGDTERYSTAGLKINKEITDIFEYVLCGTGRMILMIPAVPRPIVLDNVININKIERLSMDLLEARVVRIEQTGPHADVAVPVKDADES